MGGEIGRIWITLGAKIDGLEKSLSDVDKATKKIGTSLTSVGKQMTIAGAAITASLGLMIKKTADFGDELWDLKQRTGVAADTLSSLKLAADKSGTSLAGVAMGLKFLGRNMAEAASGGKEAAEAFQFIGVAVRNAAGGLRPMDDVMMDVADKFAAMDDGAQKTALALKLFGRSGTELIPMLNLGRAGISELREEAKRLGIVISNDAAQAADKFNDSVIALQASLSGAGMAIARSLMPTVQALLDKITDVAAGFQDWANKNQGFVASIGSIVMGAGGLLTVFGTLSIGMGALLQKLPIIAAAFGTTASSLALLTGAVSAGAAGVLYYLGILDQLSEAEAKQRSAELANVEVRSRLISQLQEAAGRTMNMVIANRELSVSAMVTSARMDEIIASFAKFGDQAEIMAKKAILAGEFGPVLQQALKDVIAESDKARKSGEKLTEVYVGLAPSVAAVAKKVDVLRKSFDSLASAQDKNLDSLMDLQAIVESLGGIVEVSVDIIPEGGGEPFLDNLLGMGATLSEQASIAARGVKAATTDMKHYFDGLYNDIANGFASAMEGLFDGTKSFKTFFINIWDTIKKAFFKVVAEMVAGFLVNFVKNIIAGMNLVKAATSAFSAFSSAAGAAGTAAQGTAGAVAAGAKGAVGASGAAGAAIGTAFTAAFLAIVAPGLLQGIGELFGGWNKPKSAEQFQSERAWIEQLTAQWKAQGLSQKQIQAKLNSINWWMSEPGSRGGSGSSGGVRGRWATGFSGLITQPTTATFAENGPEWVNVAPAGAVAGAGAGGEISMNFYAPIISTTGLTQQQCMAGMDYIFNAAEGAARKRGFSLKP